MCTEGTGPQTAVLSAWPPARCFCLPRPPRITRGLDCRSLRDGSVTLTAGGSAERRQSKSTGARHMERKVWAPRDRESGLSAVGPETNQTMGNCRWETRPGRAGQGASSRVPAQGRWDVWKASFPSSEAPEPTLPRAAALPMVLGPRAQHMAPLSGFWHRRGIYFLDEAAKIVLHLCSRAWCSRSRHFLTGPGKSNSKWIQGGCWLRRERLRGRAFRGPGRLMAGKQTWPCL